MTFQECTSGTDTLTAKPTEKTGLYFSIFTTKIKYTTGNIIKMPQILSVKGKASDSLL